MNTRTCLTNVVLLTAGVALSGCYTTTIRSGKPAAPPAAQYDGKWHSGVIYGLAELSGPYDLNEICPNGWSEITTETSFVNGLVDGLTSGIYNPQSVTVRCAAGGSASSKAKPSNDEEKEEPSADDAPAAEDDEATPDTDAEESE